MAKHSEAQSRREWVLLALERFEPVLIRYAQRLTQGDWDRTREAVQHTFVKLCQQDPDEITENLGGWLCAVCRNKLIDDARSAHRQPQLDQAILDSRPSSDDGPEQWAERTELSRLLDQRIEALPPGQRSAIELWRAGNSYAEIAALLDKDSSAVRVAVHRAIVALKADPAIADWLGADQRQPGLTTRSNRRAGSSLPAVM